MECSRRTISCRNLWAQRGLDSWWKDRSALNDHLDHPFAIANQCQLDQHVADHGLANVAGRPAFVNNPRCWDDVSSDCDWTRVDLEAWSPGCSQLFDLLGSLLEQRSIRTPTLQEYIRRAQRFVKYCQEASLTWTDAVGLDRVLVTYLDHMFWEGLVTMEPATC